MCVAVAWKSIAWGSNVSSSSHAAQLLVLVGEHQLSVASDHFRLILICVTSSQPLSPINTSRMAEASSKSPHSTLIYVSRSQQPHSHDRPSEVVGGRDRVGAAENLAGGLVLVHLLQELAVTASASASVVGHVLHRLEIHVVEHARVAAVARRQKVLVCEHRLRLLRDRLVDRREGCMIPFSHRYRPCSPSSAAARPRDATPPRATRGTWRPPPPPPSGRGRSVRARAGNRGNTA